jgi:aryl-alcohol dehydrogenase-like predicted oxidoreductase
VLARLKPNLLLGTKIRLDPTGAVDLGPAIAAGMDASLRRLGRDHVDLYQLHNPITPDGAGHTLTPRRVLDEIVPAFHKLREQGKTRFLGFTAVGDTGSIHELVASGAFDTAQVCYNLLNPSAGAPLPPGDPAQDYGLLLERMRVVGMGAIGIRVLAGGALSGAASRHPIASPPPQPIGSGPDYEADRARAQRFRFMVEEHHAATLAEAAIRFAIGNESLGVTLIGVASVDEFEHAIAAAAKGFLTNGALNRIAGSRRALPEQGA